jgi:hypothetical protein
MTGPPNAGAAPLPPGVLVPLGTYQAFSPWSFYLPPDFTSRDAIDPLNGEPLLNAREKLAWDIYNPDCSEIVSFETEEEADTYYEKMQASEHTRLNAERKTRKDLLDSTMRAHSKSIFDLDQEYDRWCYDVPEMISQIQQEIYTARAESSQGCLWKGSRLSCYFFSS